MFGGIWSERAFAMVVSERGHGKVRFRAFARVGRIGAED